MITKKSEKKKVEFNNRAIHNWKSDFSPGPKYKSGKGKERVYTPFNLTKTTRFRDLNLFFEVLFYYANQPI